MQLWLLCLASAAPRLLLRAEHRLRSRQSASQPVRCAIQVCKPFETDCSSDGECVTDKCYSGKCALGTTCSARGDTCFTDGAHTCCTGVCNPVQLRSDCTRLLGLDGGEAAKQAAFGINVDRQCEHLGVCGDWPGAPPQPSALTTPWAVLSTENPARYYALSSLTFAEGTKINVAQTVARKIGSLAVGVDPASTRPRAVTDAGVLNFVAGSRVAREISMPFKVGGDTYCIAPVLNGGLGGAYYAVGRDCCTADEFSCGDADGIGGVVVAADVNQFAQARLLLEAAKGGLYHDEERGVMTDAPMYVYWSKEPAAEQLAALPASGLSYVVPTGNTTFCTAPIGDGHGFFAVGKDCCETGTSFTCGGAADPNARSGSLAADLTGDYVQAMKQGEYLFGYKMTGRPIYLDWTSEVLVSAPS